MKIAIIDYGAGNVQSVLFALERLGFEGNVTNDWITIKSADKVIFPGVGEASSAMKMLQESGLDVLIPTLKQPVLGICLGMQLMCKHSEEGNTNGLGIFDVNVVKFSNEVKVPQMGWNTIYDFQNIIYNLPSKLFENVSENSDIYYVHSYYCELSNFTIAKTDYILEFSAALNKDNFYATQFHPEKSAGIGEQILKNFLES